MKVLHLIDSLASGGAQRQLVTLLSALADSGLDLSVAIYHPLYHFRPEVEDSGARLIVLGGKGGRDPRVLIGLARLLSRSDYDLVHSWLRTPGILARMAATVVGGPPVVVSERNTDLGASWWSIPVERMLARRAVAMIANADAVAEHVERLVPAWRGRIDVVHNGVSERARSEVNAAAVTAFRERHAREHEVLLGVVARVQKQKAPLLLLKALEGLADDLLSRVRVVWIGEEIDASLAAETRRAAEVPRLLGRFELLPSTRDVSQVYAAIDALVLPSLWEGFPNVVLEAMANGRPVVASDVGDTRKLVRNGMTGWLVPPGDVTSLSGALGDLLSASPLARRKMGEEARRVAVSEYSAARLAERTMEVYRRVLDDGRV